MNQLLELNFSVNQGRVCLCMFVAIERAVCCFTMAALSTPLFRSSNGINCKRHTCQQCCQHAYDAEEAGYSHLAKRSSRSSFPSRRGHVSTHWRQGPNSSTAVVVFSEVIYGPEIVIFNYHTL